MAQLDSAQTQCLTCFARTLIDQQRARIIVPPYEPRSAFWFGGGNLVEAAGGSLYLVGRYRNAGDSRTGLADGERGLELAIFASVDRGQSFEKVVSFAKADLDVGDRRVLSIEGSALRMTPDGVELFVSSEKDHIGYPAGFEDHLKPGTGVWTIERLVAETIEGLKDAPRETVLESADPQFLHVKDPFLHVCGDGALMLLFCSHPYCWTSSNTGYVLSHDGGHTFSKPVFDFFPRGVAWDVAMTRGTCVLDVPQVGAFEDHRVSLLFYDGGECVRNHDEHSHAVTRPRGYSCEELGGLACVTDGDFSRVERLSKHRPLFVSPHGTGCSRYVDVLSTQDGFYATWQQSQPDGSQPLVMNFVQQQVVCDLLR
jgi:hypothetical protein